MDFNNDKNDNNYIPSPVDTQAAGVPDTKTWQKNRAGSNTQSPSTPDINSSWKTSKKEMKAAGVKTDPMTGEYTQAQIDDWNKNKSTSKGLESNKTNGVKMDTEASQLEKAQTKLNNQGSDTKNSVQATEDSLDSSITSDNSDLKKNAEDFYNNKQTQTQTNELSNTKYPELDENDDPSTTAEVKDKIEGSINPAAPAGNKPSVNPSITNLTNTKKNPDGTYTPSDINPWAAASKFNNADEVGKISIAATAFSVIVSALSGGNIPPINFNKITGTDEKYKAYLKTVDDWNNNVINPARATVAATKADTENATIMNEFDAKNPNYYKNMAKLKALLPNDLEAGRAEAYKLRIAAEASKNIAQINASEQATAALISDTLKYIDKGIKDGTITKETAKYLAYGVAGSLGKSPDYVDNQAEREGYRSWTAGANVGNLSANVGQGGN